MASALISDFRNNIDVSKAHEKQTWNDTFKFKVLNPENYTNRGRTLLFLPLLVPLLY